MRTCTVKVLEHYWINNRGCHYSLTPVEDSAVEMLQFWTAKPSLKSARRAGRLWIATMESELKIKISVLMVKYPMKDVFYRKE